MIDDEENSNPAGKKYEPPVVTRISLRPEEAVLGHCKSLTASGPIGGTCNAVGNCQTIGS
jgi:hypothetical protein